MHANPTAFLWILPLAILHALPAQTLAELEAGLLTRDDGARVAALEQIARRGAEAKSLEPAVVKALVDPKAKVRLAAVAALRELRPELEQACKSLKPIVGKESGGYDSARWNTTVGRPAPTAEERKRIDAWLRSESAGDLAKGLAALREFDELDGKRLDRVKDLTTFEDRRVRRSALRTLKPYGRKKGVDLLVLARLDDESRSVRIVAVDVFDARATKNIAAAARAFARRLAEDDVRVRKLVLLHLKEHAVHYRRTDIAHAVAKMLDDPKRRDLVGHALDTLGELRTNEPKILARIIALAGGASRSEALSAVLALGDFGSVVDDTMRAKLLAAAWAHRNHRFVPMRMAVVRALAGLARGDAKALLYLVEGLQDDLPQIEMEARKAWERMMR